MRKFCFSLISSNAPVRRILYVHYSVFRTKKNYNPINFQTNKCERANNPRSNSMFQVEYENVEKTGTIVVFFRNGRRGVKGYLSKFPNWNARLFQNFVTFSRTFHPLSPLRHMRIISISAPMLKFYKWQRSKKRLMNFERKMSCFSAKRRSF